MMLRSLRFISVFLFIFLMMGYTTILAQGTMKGKITDSGGEAIIGANVFIKGTNLGAATDFEGDYTIKGIPAGSYTLIVSSVGYKTQEFNINIVSGDVLEQNATLQDDILNFDAVVITGVQNAKTNLESSVAITTIDARGIEKLAPTSTADLLKEVPGFYVETSGGDVGNNLFPRGIPSAGAYEYVQIQEDGLPVFEDGALQFANVDNFYRVDQTIDRVEAVRGGSGSIFATNAPGGIINFISKTGGNEFRGLAKLTASDYGQLRTDLNIGGPISEKLRYNVGGFYRTDKGVRSTGYPTNFGGQIKGNLTYFLDNGYVRASYRKLDDRNTFYLPIPLQNPDDPEGIEGFDPNFGTFASVNYSKIKVPQPEGGFWERNLEDGIHPNLDAIGGELFFDLGHGITAKNSMKFTNIDMEYTAIFTYGPPVNASSFAEDRFGWMNPIYSYADDGTVISDPSSLNGNGLVTDVGFWSINKKMKNFANNLSFAYNTPNNSLSLGYYYSDWSSEQEWNWSNLLVEVKGEEARLLNLVNGDLVSGDMNYSATWNGLTSISWLRRNSEVKGNINALYINDEFKPTDQFTIDAGLRYEMADYSGFRLEEDWGNPKSLGDSTTLADDNILNQTGRVQPWKYDVDKLSWSLGINYKVSSTVAAYVRGSQGWRSPIEEAYFDNYGNLDKIKPTDVKQFELGFKYGSPMFALFINGFYMTLENIAFTDILADGSSENKFAGGDNIGAEVEAIFKYQVFSINLTGTVQNPKLKDFEGVETDLNGNQVRRIPKIYVLVRPAVELTKGLNVYLTFGYFGKKFSDNDNLFELPAYSVFGAGAWYEVHNLRFAVDSYNLGNTVGLTEGNPRSTVAAAAGNIYMARPILGRSFRFSFSVGF